MEWKTCFEKYEMSETALLRRKGVKKLNLPSIKRRRIFYTTQRPDKTLYRFTVKKVFRELFPNSGLEIDLNWLYCTRDIVKRNNSISLPESDKNLRPCTDCGELQRDYRCSSCWRLLRNSSNALDLDYYGGVCLGSRQTSGGKRE